ncbi:MAG: hypothetical protein ABSD79_01895 [Dehalococcoidales bacterium]|jgi:hypothetical protein
MRRTLRNEYEVVIKHVAAPDAEQRLSSAFSLVLGAADLSSEDLSDVSAKNGRKDEEPAIEKTVKEQE